MGGFKIDFDNFGEYYEDAPDQAVYDILKITIEEVIKLIDKEPDEDEESIIGFKKILKEKIKK